MFKYGLIILLLALWDLVGGYLHIESNSYFSLALNFLQITFLVIVIYKLIRIKI